MIYKALKHKDGEYGYISEEGGIIWLHESTHHSEIPQLFINSTTREDIEQQGVDIDDCKLVTVELREVGEVDRKREIIRLRDLINEHEANPLGTSEGLAVKVLTELNIIQK